MAAGHSAAPVEDRGGRFGLCATCRHAESILSSRGAEFLLCRLSLVDAGFPKYPRVPVVNCAGYTGNPPAPSRPPTDGTR